MMNLLRVGGDNIAHQSYDECSEATTNWVCSDEGGERRGTLTFFMLWMKISIHSFSVRGNARAVLVGLRMKVAPAESVGTGWEGGCRPCPSVLACRGGVTHLLTENTSSWGRELLQICFSSLFRVFVMYP